MRLEADDVAAVKWDVRHRSRLLMALDDGRGEEILSFARDVRRHREGYVHVLEAEEETNLAWEVGEGTGGGLQRQRCIARGVGVLEEDIWSASLRNDEHVRGGKLGGQVRRELAECDSLIGERGEVCLALLFVPEGGRVLGSQHLDVVARVIDLALEIAARGGCMQPLPLEIGQHLEDSSEPHDEDSR